MAGNVQTLVKENQRLRVDLGALTDRESKLAGEKRELLKRVDILGEKVAWLTAKLFGRSSEKLKPEEREQLRLFDESEIASEDPEPEPAITVPAHSRRKAKRRPLPESLPREEVVIDIAEEEKRCGCGALLVRIGEETSEKLDVIPARFQVIRTIRPKYACRACEGSGDEEKPAVRIAPMPPQLIEKGIATAGLLAFIITAKFSRSSTAVSAGEAVCAYRSGSVAQDDGRLDDQGGGGLCSGDAGDGGATAGRSGSSDRRDHRAGTGRRGTGRHYQELHVGGPWWPCRGTRDRLSLFADSPGCSQAAHGVRPPAPSFSA